MRKSVMISIVSLLYLKAHCLQRFAYFAAGHGSWTTFPVFDYIVNVSHQMTPSVVS